MAKAKKKAARTELRRNCGAMAAHMMLLEKYPGFRMNQMRLEGATARRREMKYDPKKAKLITIKTVVHVLYKTAEQNISDAQIKSQIDVLTKDDYEARAPIEIDLAGNEFGMGRELFAMFRQIAGPADQGAGVFS